MPGKIDLEALRAIASRPDCAECEPEWGEYPRAGEMHRYRKPCPHDQERDNARSDLRVAEDYLRQEVQHARTFVGSAPVPTVFRGVGLKRIDDRECSAAGKQAAQRYVATWEARRAGGEGLTLAGDVGTGKSLIASAIVNELVERGARCLFMTVTTLQNKLRDFDRAADTLEEIRRADLLVLDDFGQEKASEWSASNLFDVIDARCQGLKPTILTTNLGAKALSEHYIRCLTHGRDQMPLAEAKLTVERIVSRIRSRNVTITFAGPDQRSGASGEWLKDG